MIIFKTDTIEIDLSNFGVSLKEESNLFSDSFNNSYSLPFKIDASEELAVKLGLPFLDNITNVQTRLRGKLITANTYYNATLFLGEILGNSIECDLSFGDQENSVFGMPLKDLPWPVILSPNLRDYAKNQLTKEWPETAFNFPMIHAPKIAEQDDYSHFLGYVNNFDGINFRQNSSALIDGETVYRNYNVLAPFPYLLEILRFGFSLEGKIITGPAVNDELLRKVVYIPENFLERFRGTEFQSFSFSTADEVATENDVSLSIYKRSFTLEEIGEYNIKFKLNLDPIIAEYFELKVTLEHPSTFVETEIFTAQSQFYRVKMEEELKLNITSATQLHTLKVVLKLKYQSASIAGTNQFEYAYSDGRLNEFPTYFSLANFLPDMNFGEFVNTMKNWLNLDFTIGDHEVHINFTQDSILEKPRRDHNHLEIPKPNKKHNSNRFYQLSYANGQRVFYKKQGQIYSDLEEDGEEIIKIDMDVQPADYKLKDGHFTAIMPEDRCAIDFLVYDGFQGSRPFASPDRIRELFLQAVYLKYWQQWLSYRVNSKTFKESFECSVYERISIDELSYKYSELHVIKKLSRKFLSEKTMRVTIESETF
jgi:hypothetical protein